MRYLCVLGGGAVGSLLRYMTAVAVATWWTGRFPLATFVINVTGSFAIGVLATVLTEAANPLWRPLLIAGLLGGFTTFSAFEYEALATARAGDGGIAMLYVLGSVVCGFAACWLGSASVGLWSK